MSNKWKFQGFGSVSGSAWIPVNLSCWIRIRIQEEKNGPKNRKKSRIFMFLSTGCSLLRADSFSCSLGILYGGLGISKLQFLIKKIEIKFPSINFFQFKVIKPWIRIRIRIRIKSMRIRHPAGCPEFNINTWSGTVHLVPYRTVGQQQKSRRNQHFTSK